MEKTNKQNMKKQLDFVVVLLIYLVIVFTKIFFMLNPKTKNISEFQKFWVPLLVVALLCLLASVSDDGSNSAIVIGSLFPNPFLFFKSKGI